MSKQPKFETVGARDDRWLGRWEDWANLILGAWLIIAPFTGLGGTSDIAAWNSYVAGTAVAIFALAALVRPQLWEEWLNLVVGAWLVIAPFALGFTDQYGVMWNQIVVGLAIAGVALWAVAQWSGQRAHHA